MIQSLGESLPCNLASTIRFQPKLLLIHKDCYAGMCFHFNTVSRDVGATWKLPPLKLMWMDGIYPIRVLGLVVESFVIPMRELLNVFPSIQAIAMCSLQRCTI